MSILRRRITVLKRGRACHGDVTEHSKQSKFEGVHVSVILYVVSLSQYSKLFGGGGCLRGKGERNRAKKTVSFGRILVKRLDPLLGDGFSTVELDYVYIDFGGADGRR